METITLSCLLARSKILLGMTSQAGCAGRGKQIDRVRDCSGARDESFFSTLTATTLLVVNPATLLSGASATVPSEAATSSVGLNMAPRKRRHTVMNSLSATGVPCLALAGVRDIPDVLVRYAKQTSTFVFGSRFDEHLLTSRLAGLLREKLHRRLLVQGALVNVCGRGILITGDSGAGKTTWALELARRGHTWIADDAVEIEQRRGGRLYGRGQAMVKHLLEIKEIGVLPVQNVLVAAAIADETAIDVVVELRRNARPCTAPSPRRRFSTIMGVRLPLVKISCSPDRDEQLEKAVKSINQTG